VEKDDDPEDEWFKKMYSESSMNRDELTQSYYEYIHQRLGGKPYFSDRRGHPNLVSFHAQVGVTIRCQHKWLTLMEDAIDALDELISSDQKSLLMTFFTHLCSTYQVATKVMESHESCRLYDDDFPINCPVAAAASPAPAPAVTMSTDGVSRHKDHRK
jgi:truncated hemoglobin YjbI